MTNEDKRNYLLRFHRFQKSREKYFAPKIFAAIRSQYNTLLSALDNGYTEQQAILKINSAPIIKVLNDLYVDAGIVYGAKVRADLNKARKKHFAYQFQTKARMPMGFSEQMRQLILDYFSIDILNQSEGITETTRDLIRQIFTNGYELGEGIDDIVSKLKDTELSRVRSRLIARTETVTAANQGALFVAKDTGLNLNKEWLSANDHRVRQDHRAENGQIIGINDLFTVGSDLMLHPGDHGGKNGRLKVSAKNICNCRCTCLYIPIDDDATPNPKPVLPAKPVYVPANSIKEAEELAATLGIKADYSGINVRMANHINTELFELNSKTKGFNIVNDAMGTENLKAFNSIKAVDMVNNKVANYNMLTGEIQINKNYWKDADSWAGLKERFKGSSIGEIHPRVALAHEIGHGYGKYWNSDGDDLYSVGQKIYNRLEGTVLSKYAMTNSEEMVAESFAAYINYGKLPPQLNELMPIFKKILNQ